MSVDKMRPITVLNTIMRLWSSAKFRLLRGWMESRLPKAFASGRSGGETSAIIVDIALRLEAAMAGLEEDAQVVTTDFSKFFDCIPWPLVSMVAREMGLPLSLLRLYEDLYKRMERHVSIGKWTSESSIIATNGVIQGDAMSLLWAAIALVVWVLRIEGEYEGITHTCFCG